MRSDPPNASRAAPDDHPGWRAVAGNSFWLALEKACRWILALTVGVWLARHLGPEGYGSLSATLSWAALFAAAAGLGIEPIVVRELVRRPAEQATLLATAIGLRIAGGALAAAATVAVAAVWPAAAPTVALTAIASLVTLFGLGDAFDLWFQARLQARTAALARTLVFAGASAARVALILQGAGVAPFLWLAAVEAALTAGVLGVILARATGDAGARRFSPAVAREFLREGWPNIVSNLAGIAYLRADRVMLAAMSGDAAAGVYSAAVGLVEVWYVFPVTLVNSANPLLTRLHGGNPAGFHFELARLARLNSAVAWLLAAILAGGSPWLVPLLFGPDYAGAAPVLALLAGCLPFAFLGVAVSPWYLNEGLTRLAMRRHLLGGGLNLGLNYLLIPRWGPAGAAAATLVAFAIAHVFANALDRRSRPIFHLQWRALWLRPSTPSP